MFKLCENFYFLKVSSAVRYLTGWFTRTHSQILLFFLYPSYRYDGGLEQAIGDTLGENYWKEELKTQIDAQEMLYTLPGRRNLMIAIPSTISLVCVQLFVLLMYQTEDHFDVNEHGEVKCMYVCVEGVVETVSEWFNYCIASLRL